MAKAKTPRKTTTNVTPIDSKPIQETKRTTVHNGNLEDVIRQRAYELYLHRGSGHGLAHEDWFRAEAEVRAGYNRTA
jgi:hypothetical protein